MSNIPQHNSRTPLVRSSLQEHHPLAKEGKGRGNSEWSLAHCLTNIDRLTNQKSQDSLNFHVPILFILHHSIPMGFPFRWFHSIYAIQNSRKLYLGKRGMVSRIRADYRREFLRGEFPHSAGAWGILQSPVSVVSRGDTAKSSGSEQKELGLSSGLCPLTSCVNLGKRLKSLNLCFLSYKIRSWDLYSLSYCED